MSQTEEPIVYLNLRVPASLRKTLKLYATNHDTTVVDVVIEAVREYLKKAKEGKT
jgi:hypothetical protein